MKQKTSWIVDWQGDLQTDFVDTRIVVRVVHDEDNPSRRMLSLTKAVEIKDASDPRKPFTSFQVPPAKIPELVKILQDAARAEAEIGDASE